MNPPTVPSRTALRWRTEHKIEQFYPDTGPLRRELYVKHLQFFEAGATFAERCFMAANRVAKSEGVGTYEMTLHLTGKYPRWWKGPPFHPANFGMGSGQRRNCMDVGWSKTAAISGALDRGNELTGEHYRGQVEPPVHAAAIKARGNMLGFIDPAANTSSQIDGHKLLQIYQGLGLTRRMADQRQGSGHL